MRYSVRYFIVFILYGISITALGQDAQGNTLAPEKLALLHAKADSIVTYGIINRAFPGAQVLVAKEGAIVFHKAYGFHTYDSLQPVLVNDLYDLASVTKILGPLPILMKLYEEGVISLDEPFSTYWRPWRHRKDKKDLTLRAILAHQAGLKPYIVFLNEVMRNDRLKNRFFRTKPSRAYGKQAYDNLYVKNSLFNKISRTINRSEVDENKVYRYSGLAFLLFPELIEQLTGHSYEYLLQKEFFIPLETPTLGFLPATKGFTNAIVPTEYDERYRKLLVKGWVHDENASLFGGIAGNAGLFGSAHDLFRIMQLYQNYGQLDGRRYLSEKTLKEFTSTQFPENGNRRGLGFDKPLLNNASLGLEAAYPAPSASKTSFGHSGFTGTFVWADPEKELVYILLSNRVYPTREHRKLYDLTIRISLHQLFYDFFD